MADDFFGQQNNQPAPTQPQSNYIDEYVPPQMDATDNSMNNAGPVPAMPAAPAEPIPQSQSGETSQSLEDQNIFTLLGVEDGTDEEKESFLDELQQVIWEDFLDNDVELLLTEQEMTDLKVILDKSDVSDMQKQEEAVVFLEKLIPDLEEIMLEKALELKEAMVRERLTGLMDFYKSDASKNDALAGAEAAVNQGQWKTAAEIMNTIK